MNLQMPLGVSLRLTLSHSPLTGDHLEDACESLLHLDDVLGFSSMKKEPFLPLATVVKQNLGSVDI
jgi:hypothetical protein